MKIFTLLSSNIFRIASLKGTAMPASLQIKVWSVLVYVVVTAVIAIWLHPSVLLAAGAFG
ncbi:hypothetical protein [Janthinobacterium sp. GMG2]|uniref:hypothetical protein n=1 Tax=Janthinobacterium sp. GMG2 TaxID=3096606 RepID=UPI0029F59ACE|nr:hypothetical protein [Janthinobacterium sp. GMG2]